MKKGMRLVTTTIKIAKSNVEESGKIENL